MSNLRFSSPVFFLLLLSILAAPSESAAEHSEFRWAGKRIVFLGDSITHAGQYIAEIEARMRLAGVDPMPELINLGLPSETCSGLSEPDHPFPRPDVHERMGRALKKLKPDVLVACYGMNDGIYHPFSETRFQAFRNGIDKIIEKGSAAGAQVVLMTSPPFDPLPQRKQGKLLPENADRFAWFSIYERYDDVLSRYADWVLQQADRVAMVIDLRTPVADYVSARREQDPDFTMSGDGVHLNDEGHRILAVAILKAWGIRDTINPEVGLLNLVSRRQHLMHDAWLSEVGHQRPGVKAGLPLDEAQAQAAEIATEIERAERQLDVRH